MSYLYDEPRKLAKDIGWRWVMRSGVFEPEEVTECYEKIDLEILRNSAKDIFQSGNLTFYVLNNPSVCSSRKLKKELQNLRLVLDHGFQVESV